MTILVTGSAGFIGSVVSQYLLARGELVVGLDNYNDYYDVSLKEARVKNLLDHRSYSEVRASIEDRESLEGVFKKNRPRSAFSCSGRSALFD